jgi:hypothetical protein
MGGLPSWVLNWSKDTQGHLQLQPLRKPAYWNVSGPKRAQSSFADEGKILLMDELNIGCIRTEGYYTSILTWKNSVTVRKGEQGCFIGITG